MDDKITQFCKTLTSVDYSDIIELGKSLGIISYDRDMDTINWDDFPDSAEGEIRPLGDAVNFWYFIEFADDSLSNDHIQSSIEEARAQAIRTRHSNFSSNRKRLLIICQHDDDAVLVDRKINENFSHDSPEQSNNPHVFVIRWSDVRRAHNNEKICSWCNRGNLKEKGCNFNRCSTCCSEQCRNSCKNHEERQRLHDDWVHRSDYG